MAEQGTTYDVIIAGGGPGGLSAALWCAELGLSSILLEKETELGGQLLHIYNAIKNYIGIEAGSGRELCDVFLRQINAARINRLTDVEIVKADLTHKTVTLADGRVYSSRAIIIATGVRRRKLMVPGEEEFRGCGVLESGSKDKDKVHGKAVVIIGGGDAALENALILSDTARKIIVVHRRDALKARTEFVRAAQALANIEFCLDAQIIAILGKEDVEAVEIEHLTDGRNSQVKTDAVLIRIGVEPNTELFFGQIDLDDAGYVIVDARCATSLEGIFGVGDVVNHLTPTIAAAVGQGSIAAKAISRLCRADTPEVKLEKGL